jgi:NUMOD3 motif
MDIKQALSQLDHSTFWLDRYIGFLEDAKAPQGAYDKHHILPVSMFPEFKSFRRFPWNRIDLRPADHLLAHYYLYRALPGEGGARKAFIAMTNLRYRELVDQNHDETLVKEIAEKYEKARFGIESTIKGWVRIYRNNEECSVCAPDQLEQRLSEGWKEGVPNRVWVVKGNDQHLIAVSSVPKFLADGFVLGRINQHTEDSRKAIQTASLEYHQQEAVKDNAYSYMPRGDQHRRRILGCPDDVAEKIAKTLLGRKLTPEHAAKSRTAAVGKTWSWSPEAKARKSQAMMGEGNNRFGKEGYWKDKTRPQETRNKMSDSQQEFRKDPENVAALDASRPRGEDHPFFGKTRDEETRTKISDSLTGKTQSQATKDKRSQSLRDYHAKKRQETGASDPNMDVDLG